MTLRRKRQQVAIYLKASTGAFGATTSTPNPSNVLAAGNVLEVYEVNSNPTVQTTERATMSPYLDNPSPVKGSRFWEITFNMAMTTSGTAGTAPKIGTAFKACMMAEAINSGSASIGSVIEDPRNIGTASAPAVAGTFAGAKSGKMVITVAAVSASTSVTFDVVFFPGDNTSRTYYNAEVQNSGSAVTLSGGVLDGVTVDFGDPSSSTTGIEVGDQFIINLQSSSQAEVTYTPENTPSFYADIAVIRDGKLLKVRNCQGTFVIRANAGEPAMAEFTFRGSDAGQDDQALLTGVTIDDNVPQPLIGATWTVAAAAAGCPTTFTLDNGGELVMRACATEDDGYLSAEVVNRAATFEWDPLDTLTATRDDFARFFGQTTYALNLQWGETTGSIIQITARNMSYTDIQQGDREGLISNNTTAALARPNFDAGGDYSPFVITFK